MLVARNVPAFDRFFDSVFQEAARPLLVRGGSNGSYFPAIDVRESEEALLFLVDVPGMKAEDLEVTLEKGVLTIQGKREDESDAESVYRTRRFGSFKRSFTLPDAANADDLRASLKDGVLSIRVGKAPAAGAKKIAIEAGADLALPEAE